MGKLAGHESCPDCGSKDNLARYMDGSGYCFGCGRVEPPTNSSTQTKKSTFIPKKRDTSNYEYDFYNFNKSLQNWLLSYGLTPEDITFYKFAENKSTNSLVMPVYHDGDLHLEQHRFFTGNVKYMTIKVIPEARSYFILKGNKTAVIVEDIISAIRIRDLGYTALALLGTGATTAPIGAIRKITEKAYVWLDNDNPSVKKASFHIMNLCGLCGLKSFRINATQEPKHWTKTKLAEYLEGLQCH